MDSKDMNGTWADVGKKDIISTEFNKTASIIE